MSGGKAESPLALHVFTAASNPEDNSNGFTIEVTSNGGNKDSSQLQSDAKPSLDGKKKLDYKILWTHYSCPLVLLLLSLATAIITIGIGIAGAALPLSRGQNIGDDYLEPYYLQAAATVLILPLSLMSTFLVVTTIHTFRKLREEELRLKRKRNKPRIMRQNAVIEDDDNENVVLDTLDSKKLVQSKQIDLEKFTVKSTILLWIAMMLLNLSVSCLLWGITLANNYALVPEKSAYTFPLVEIMMGVICPALLILFIFVSVFVLRIITQNKIKAEKLIPGLMTFVSFKEGDRFWFWVVVDRFYFKIKNNEHHIPSRKKKIISCHNNVASWCIVIIISVTIILSFSFFVSESFTESESADTCAQALTKPNGFDCFDSRWTFVDCNEANVSDHTRLTCYRFLTVEDNSDYLRALIQALFIYIACDKFLSVLFRLVTALYSFRKTKLWGIIIVTAGVIMLIISIGSTFVFLLVRNDNNILSNVQFFIISLDIFLAGLLMTVGMPYEQVEHKKPAKLLLRGLTTNTPSEVEKALDSPSSLS